MIDGDIRQVLRLAPVSRQLEEEADRLGMMMAADAGYDPAKMAAYFRIAGESSGVLAGTHAANARRIASLETLLPVARQAIRPIAAEPAGAATPRVRRSEGMS